MVKFGNFGLTWKHILLLVILGLILTACVCNASAGNGERVLILKNGQVQEMLPAGERKTTFDPYTSAETIDVKDKLIEWSDPDLVTKDQQPIGITLSVVYARSADEATIKKLFQSNPEVAKDDAALQTFVESQIGGATKNVTVAFTLNQMLGVENLNEAQVTSLETAFKLSPQTLKAIAGRELAAFLIKNQLTEALQPFGILVRDVVIKNLAPSPEYMALLEQKGNKKAEQDVLREQRITDNLANENANKSELEKLEAQRQQAEAQLAVEEALTKVRLEIAGRDAQELALIAEVYANNPLYAQVIVAQTIATALQNAQTLVLPENFMWTGQLPTAPVPGQ